MRKYIEILNEAISEAPLHNEPVTAESLLRDILAAWDEPHRGDLETARDEMFDPIEKARAYLQRNAGTLSEGNFDYDGIVGYCVVERGPDGLKIWGDFHQIYGAEQFAHSANNHAATGVTFTPHRILDWDHAQKISTTKPTR